MLELADKIGRWLENAMLALLLGGMIMLACAQIALRDLGFGSILWGDEAIRLMVLWIAMVAGVAAAREDKHIAIDVLSRFVSGRAGLLIAVVVDLFTASVCLALAWFGTEMVQFALEDGDVLLQGVPAWLLQAIVPLAFLLMGWRYLIWAGRRCRDFFAGDAAC